MTYPVKLEFKIYPSGAWEDWSMYLSEAPSISRKVESDNEGEAGLIVFDNASVSLYYAEGNPVYAAFRESNLTSAIRYMFRISAPKSDGTYELLFEGMADFSTIEWPEESRLISFEIVDKLSALTLLPDAPYRAKQDLTARIKQQYPEARSMFVVIAGQTGALVNGFIQLHPEGDEVTTFLDLHVPVINSGEYVSVFGEDEKEQIMLVVASTVEGKFNYVQFAWRDNLQSKNYNLTQNPVLYYTDSPFGGTDINILSPDGGVLGFNGLKIAESIIKQQWPDVEMVSKPGDFTQFFIPVTYDSQLQVYNPFNKSGLDALKMLADSMFCYIYFNREGKLVLQKKDSLGVNGTARSIGSARAIDASKRYFWDKLVDGVTVEAQGWLYVNNELVTGTGTVVKTLPGSTDYLEPENEIKKEVLAETTEQSTESDLKVYAVSIASKYLSFYGTRHASWECEYALDDNTIMWDLLDNLTLSESCFFTKIDYDLDSRMVSVELVSVAGYDYDVRQIRKTKSESSYNNTSSGGSSSSSVIAAGGYSGNPYLWDGGAIGLNAVNARQNLGLKNILNIGDGIIGNAEFNRLAGVASNIQEQLNSKERTLSFTNPLVRSGDQISLPTGLLSLGTNSNGFTITGSGKLVGNDLTINFPQRLDSAGTPRFAKLGIGGDADASYLLKVYGSEYVTGAFRADGNGRIARLGVGGDADANYILKAYGNGYFTGNILVDGDIYIGGRINQVNVTDLYVADKNIILNRGGDNTTAINAGIKIEGASASLLASVLYDGTSFTASHDFNTASGKGYKVNNALAIDSSRNFFGASGTFTGKITAGSSADAEALNINGYSLFSGYIGHPSFASQTSAWRISSLGEADFRYVYTDELHAKAVIADLEQGLAGGQIIAKSVAKLAKDFTLPAAGASAEIEVEGFAGFPNSLVFQEGDIIGIKVFARPEYSNEVSLTIGYAWGSVGFNDFGQVENTRTQKWNFQRSAGSLAGTASGIVKAGTLVVDYGKTGNGYYEVSAIDGLNGINSPYAQTAVWHDHPSIKTIGARFGNMRGIAGAPWGEQAIHGLYADVAWLTENVMIGGRSLGLLSGMTALFHFDDNDYDSISGIKPSYTGTKNETSYGLVSSSDNSLVYTKQDGKFGGGIAVEEATTNLETVFDFASTWNLSNFTREILSGGYYRFTCTDNTNGNRAIYKDAYTMSVGYNTFSIDVRNNAEPIVMTVMQKTGTTANTSTTIPANSNGRFSVTSQCTAAGTCYVFIYINNKLSGSLGKYFEVRRPQWEAKSYATSFVEGSRAYGALKFANDIRSGKTYMFYAKLNGSGITRLWSSVNTLTQRLGVLVSSDYRIDVEVNAYIPTTYYLNNFNGKNLVGEYAHWVITITESAVNFYLEGVLIKTQAYSSALPISPVYLGAAAAGSQTSAIYDEYAVFDRALTQDEIKRIFYSNQPLQESPGMTFISGNKIRTGDIYSENYAANSQGMRIGLNSASMEMNFGGKNIFKFDSASASANIAGWDFNSSLLYKTLGSFSIQIGGTASTPLTSAMGRMALGVYGTAESYYPTVCLWSPSSINTYVRMYVTNSGPAIQAYNAVVGMNAMMGYMNYYADQAAKTAGTWTYDNGFLLSDSDIGYVVFTKNKKMIAGWKFNSDSIWAGSDNPAADGAYSASGMTLGSAGYISAPNTFISSSGVLCSKSGNIAGYSFDSGKLYVGTDFVLDAAGKKLYFSNKSTLSSVITSTDSGIFLGYDSTTYKFAIGNKDKFFSWNGTDLTAYGATINGSTITGGTIQTASSGQRVVMSGWTNSLSFYNNSEDVSILRGDSLGGLPAILVANEEPLIGVQYSLEYNKGGAFLHQTGVTLSTITSYCKVVSPNGNNFVILGANNSAAYIQINGEPVIKESKSGWSTFTPTFDRTLPSTADTTEVRNVLASLIYDLINHHGLLKA